MQPWLKTALGLLLFGTFWVELAPSTKAADDKSPLPVALPDHPKSEETKVNIAIPVGEPVKGIHLPFYDLSGKLKMQFDAETANRKTENLIDMTALKIETYDEKGNRDMLVQFPVASFDLATSMIRTKDRVEVRRNDFVLTGVGMEFNTKERSGRVFSQIRMEIFNRQAETATPTPTPTPVTESTPTPTPNGP